MELFGIALVPHRIGMMFDLGRDYAVYAELLKRKGYLAQAEENLNKAIEIFRECGADWWVKKAQEALVQMKEPGHWPAGHGPQLTTV